MGLQHVGKKLGLANGAFWHERAMPVLLPNCRQRIVARFGREGKPDHAWKSRIFNNLACARVAGPACILAPCRTEPGVGACHAPPRAIVVLVERGGAMIATRPDKGIFAPHERFQTQVRPRTLQERLP